MIDEEKLHICANQIVNFVKEKQLTEIEQICLYASLTKSAARNCKAARE